MDDRERRGFEMFGRVQDFGAESAGDFPAGTLGNELFGTLNTAVADMERQLAAQSSGAGDARRGTVSKSAARRALRDDLDEISRTARAMAFESPGLDEKFRLPRPLNDQVLLTTARSFAADAVALKDSFIRHELPADFLEDLAADIAEFEAGDEDQNLGREDQVSAGAAFDDAYDKAMNAVRRLRVLVRNKYRNNAAKLAAWERASHIERTPRQKTAPPAQTPPQA
jgi:hypothetical protein